MAKIKLGQYEFRTKKEAQELYREILNNTQLDEPLEGENFEYVLALLLSHPKVTKKIGCGLKSLIVSEGKYNGSRCFHLVREDNTIEDFSIGKCINGDHSDFHKFLIAARRVVEDDILQYKIKYFEDNGNQEKKVKCQLTGELITKGDTHVDHREPMTFSVIGYFFVNSNEINLSQVQYINENQYGNIFQDQKLIEEFKTWHHLHAKLRIVAKKKNLEKGYLGRVSATKYDGIL